MFAAEYAPSSELDEEQDQEQEVEEVSHESRDQSHASGANPEAAQNQSLAEIEQLYCSGVSEPAVVETPEVQAEEQQSTEAAPAPDQAAAEEPAWVLKAKAYNRRHEGLVAQFNQATHDATLGADGEAAPTLVAGWQTSHDLEVDGRIGPATVAAAQPQVAAAEPAAAEQAPAQPAVTRAAIKPAAPRAPAVEDARPAPATTAVAPPVASAAEEAKRLKLLRGQYDGLLKAFEGRAVTQAEAVQKLIAYDRKLNGGASSVEGMAMLPMFLVDIFAMSAWRLLESPKAEAKGVAPAAKPPTPKAADKPTASAKPAAGAGHLFADALQVVAPSATLLTKPKKGTSAGRSLAAGTKVFVVKADRTYVQVVTAPGAAEAITESDNLWTVFANLGGTGHAVKLGNENTDADAKAKADQLRSGLPEGRNPGQSKFKWGFQGHFMPDVEGTGLSGSLMGKIHRLMEWAVENDMVTKDIEISDGVRPPKTAHRNCTAFNIVNTSLVKFETVKNLPGGKDLDGNKWYEDGWTWEQVQENAKKVGKTAKIAAAGYGPGDPRRLPLNPTGKPGLSRHCTGLAVDVTIPWRSAGDPRKTDVWAWEEIYEQFGLVRPLHRDKTSNPKNQEPWHIEEISGTVLEPDEETDDIG